MCVKEGRPVPVGDPAAAEFVLGPVKKKKPLGTKTEDVKGLNSPGLAGLAGKDMLVRSLENGFLESFTENNCILSLPVQFWPSL